MKPTSDERVLLAVFDVRPEKIDHLPVGYKDGSEEIGLAVYTEGDRYRVLDAVAGARTIRWWKVEAIARAEKLQPVALSYDGPASEIPKRFLVRSDAGDTQVVLIRLAERGPWCELTRQEPVAPEASGG